QRRRQRPAAAQAPRAVDGAHADGARGPVAPVGHHEAERRPTSREAALLPRSELVEGGRGQDSGRHVATVALPGQGADRRTARRDGQRVGQDAGGGPQREVTPREQGDRRPRALEPSVDRHHRRGRRWLGMPLPPRAPRSSGLSARLRASSATVLATAATVTNATSATQSRPSATVKCPTGGMWKKLNARALTSDVSRPSRSPQRTETRTTAGRYTTPSETPGATPFSG